MRSTKGKGRRTTLRLPGCRGVVSKRAKQCTWFTSLAFCLFRLLVVEKLWVTAGDIADQVGNATVTLLSNLAVAPSFTASPCA